MSRLYVGMDVHRKKTVYVIQDKDGKVHAEGHFETHREGIMGMVQKHKLDKGTQVCMECGAQASVVCDALEEIDMLPVVVNAAEVRKKARRKGQKTDRRDAFEICDGLRRGIWDSIVYMPPPHIRRLRQILSRRRHFVGLSTQQINAAKYLLRSDALLSNKRVSLTSTAAWAKLLKMPEIESVSRYVELHAKTWEHAAGCIKLIEEDLQEALDPVDEVMDWLTSVPGVGLITAACFIATVGDPTRFADSNHVVSYLGLAPAMYDSGETERHGHITKAGSPYMRSLLCEVAQRAARRTNPLNPYFSRITVKSGYKKAAVAIAQRTARIMYRMWLNKERFDITKLNVERDGKVRTRVYNWRIKRPERAA